MPEVEAPVTVVRSPTKPRSTPTGSVSGTAPTAQTPTGRRSAFGPGAAATFRPLTGSRRSTLKTADSGTRRRHSSCSALRHTGLRRRPTWRVLLTYSRRVGCLSNERRCRRSAHLLRIGAPGAENVSLIPAPAVMAPLLIDFFASSSETGSPLHPRRPARSGRRSGRSTAALFSLA